MYREPANPIHLKANGNAPDHLMDEGYGLKTRLLTARFDTGLSRPPVKYVERSMMRQTVSH